MDDTSTQANGVIPSSAVESPKYELSFEGCIDQLISDITAIEMTLLGAMRMSLAHMNQKHEEVTEYLGQNGSIVEEDSDSETYSLDSINVHVLREKVEQHEVAMAAPVILSNAMFASLVFRWDAFFANLLRLIYRCSPSIINASSRSLTFAEVVAFGSIDEAGKAIVEAEIEELMRGSHAKQFDKLNAYLGKVEGSKSIKEIDEWKPFIELTERRNVIVHADGIISKQYLDVCREHKIALGKNIKMGGNLRVPFSYMKSACDTLTKLGVILGHYLWQKFDKNSVKDRESHHIQVSYRLIKEKRYAIAIRLIEDFLSDKRNLLNEFTRKAAYINLAQAQKWMNDIAGMERTLTREDLSYSRDNILLAVHVLRDEFSQAGALMEKIGPEGDIEQADYDEWPLFEQFRESEYFKNAYNKLFGDAPLLENVKISTPAIGVLEDQAAGVDSEESEDGAMGVSSDDVSPSQS